MPPRFPQLPFFGIAAGLRTQMGTLIPPGGQVVAYVRSTGVQSGDDNDVRRRLLPTLNAAMALCRSGMDDVIVVLPGHVETVSTADFFTSLVAGTKIVGIGRGSTRPKLTWSVAGSTFLFDVANVELSGFHFEMAGDPALTAALSVAAPITISAAGCAIRDCTMRTSIDADQLATIPITTTAAADDLVLSGLHMFGATAGESTTLVRLVGADRLVMRDCKLQAATSSTTVGVVQFLTTASLDVEIDGCIFQNRKAASVHAVTGMAGATGVVRGCAFGILDNATLAGLVTPGDLMGFGNYVVNLAGEQGSQAGTAGWPVST